MYIFEKAFETMKIKQFYLNILLSLLFYILFQMFPYGFLNEKIYILN